MISTEKKTELLDFRQYRLAQLVKDSNDVLDIGYAALPNKYLTNTKIVGLDLAEVAKPEHYTEVVQGDALKLPTPFEQESFSRITAGEILEHIEHPIDFLRACHRTLKTGGKLVVSTPNPNSVYERILTLGLSRRFFYDPEHIMLYPQRWLIRIAEIAGFRRSKILSGGIALPFCEATLPFPRPWAEFSILVAEK
jgi:SAM-dependent methyltransferase